MDFPISSLRTSVAVSAGLSGLWHRSWVLVRRVVLPTALFSAPVSLVTFDCCHMYRSGFVPSH